MKRTLLVISFYFAILMSAGQLHASVDVDFEEYFPLHVGNSWTLVDEFNTTYLNQVTGTVCLGTISTYKHAESENAPDYKNYSYKDGSLVWAGANGKIYDPPLIIDGQDIILPDQHLVFEVASPINTPAGVFNDVIKMTIYKEVGGKEFATRIKYFAKGVGLVKDEDWCASCDETYQFTALLTAYEIAGASGTDLITCIFPETGTITLVPVYSLLLD